MTYKCEISQWTSGLHSHPPRTVWKYWRLQIQPNDWVLRCCGSMLRAQVPKDQSTRNSGSKLLGNVCTSIISNSAFKLTNHASNNDERINIEWKLTCNFTDDWPPIMGKLIIFHFHAYTRRNIHYQTAIKMLVDENFRLDSMTIW